MRNRKFANFTAAVLLGLAAGSPSRVSADDTEIYLGSDELFSEQGQVKPNVLLLLDTSGSMAAQVTGTGLSRLDNMKIALKTILDTSDNINVGLMRFTDPGGPIVFPVADIDKDIAEIEKGGASSGVNDIFVRVAPSSADDASQVLPTNPLEPSEVDTNAIVLPFGPVAAQTTAPVTVISRTGMGANQNDNTHEERISDGAEVTGSQINFINTQLDGIRFPNILVPQGARIISANMFGQSPADFTSTSAQTLTFRAVNQSNTATFANASNAISGLPLGGTTFTWANPEQFFTGQTYPQSDLPLDMRAMVQEIVCFGTTAVTAGCPTTGTFGADGLAWSPGNAMSFVITATSGTNRGFRSQGNAGTGTANEPRQTRLEVTYDTGIPAGDSVVGLRFNDIALPQGVTITSARIEFVAAQTSAADTVAPKYEITGHLVDNSTTFANSGQKINGRPQTAAAVTWAGADLPGWVEGANYRTPDLTPIVQEIVNQAGWCGNNSMSFQVKSIEGDVAGRIAYSSNFIAPSPDPNGANGAFAPILVIDFDETSIPAGGGCINQIVSSAIFTSDDDAEQNTGTGAISLTSQTLNMESAQITGLRYRDLNIPKDATILEAFLTFTSQNIDTSASTITFTGEATDNALSFKAAGFDISNRPDTAASVAWTVPSFEALGQKFTTVNLAPIVQEIVNRAGWAAGNDLVLFQTTTGDDREAKTFNLSPAEAPKLRIKVAYGGSVIPPLVKTVRDRLKELVDTYVSSGYTPLVGQYYEAAQYYRGGPVFHGARRSHRAAQQPVTRLSHPASYTGGTVAPAECADPNNALLAQCLTETISGQPIYESPVEAGCQSNNIVLLTDGEANHNGADEGQDHSVSLAQSLVGGSCVAASTGELCGRDLSKFMFDEDLLPGFTGKQNVKTYTIGFNLCDGEVIDGVCCVSGAGVPSDPANPASPLTCPVGSEVPATGAIQYLRDVASVGGGGFFNATSASDLANVFETIFADILAAPTSFAAPALSVNAFNRLFNRNEIYLALFEPSTNVAWDGNVKKYNICDLIEYTGCDLGDVLDANGDPAIGADFRIRDTAQSEWSAGVDGIQIRSGGAGEQVPAADSRNVYTYTGVGAPVDVDLTITANEVVDSNAALTKDMLGDPLMTDGLRTTIIEWIRGKDTENEDDNASTTERFNFEDPLHASPIAITFGGDENDPVDKLFAATNGGGLRMLNAQTGVEEWVFIPQELLGIQNAMRVNAVGDHIYGLDLTPTPWINDNDADGKIEPSNGDFVHLFQAMRRGGQNLYALDVTPSATLTNPTATGGIDPRLRWRILGGAGGTTGFDSLGQTWSRPRLVKIRVVDASSNNVARSVLIFGGGYDPSFDKTFGTSTLGNGVYIVDAETGSLIASIGGDDGNPAVQSFSLEMPGMNYPVPADIGVLDSNGDGAIDRLYFGDIGGNVWRVDLKDDLPITGAQQEEVGIAGRLADTSVAEGAVAGPHAAETRKFHSAPDIVKVLDETFSDEPRYDLVLIGSGAREDPLSTIIKDRFFAFRDFAVNGLKDTDGGGDGDGIVDSDDPTFHMITLSTMTDVTSNPFQLNADGTKADPTAFDAFLPQITGSKGDGWFIDLKSGNTYIGEKVLSKPIVLAGKLFFTTYIPEVDDELINACQLSEGGSNLYGLSVLSGAALFSDWNSSGNNNPNTADRTTSLGGGIASDPVALFQKEGVTIIVGCAGGVCSVDPNVPRPRERTYWYELGQ